jgi:predicted deacetylase
MPELNDDNEEALATGRAVKDDDDDDDTVVSEIDLSGGQEQEEDYPVLSKHNKKFFAIVTIHDVAPEYSDKIFRAADELEKLGIHYNLAIIPYLKKRKENLISGNPEFVKKVLGYGQEIALHGNYHETEDGKIEDFHTYSIEEAKNHLQNAINVVKEAGISNTNVFIPPTWAINKPTIDDLIQLGFRLAEAKEEILMIYSKKKTKRLRASVLNWDEYGSPQKNKGCLTKNKQLYRLKVMQRNSQLIRIAIHPRDPEEALQDQIEMIQGLKDMNYSFLGYGEMIRVEWEKVAEERKEKEKILSSQRAQS